VKVRIRWKYYPTIQRSYITIITAQHLPEKLAETSVTHRECGASRMLKTVLGLSLASSTGIKIKPRPLRFKSSVTSWVYFNFREILVASHQYPNAFCSSLTNAESYNLCVFHFTWTFMLLKLVCTIVRELLFNVSWTIRVPLPVPVSVLYFHWEAQPVATDCRSSRIWSLLRYHSCFCRFFLIRDRIYGYPAG